MNEHKQWLDPKLWISAALIGLFAWAFGENPDDETMRGALILAFATAYGYWLGSNKGDSQRTDNTTKALEAIKAAQEAPPPPPTPDVILEPGETAQAAPANDESGKP